MSYAEKICPDCEEPFIPTAGNQKLCKSCRDKKPHYKRVPYRADWNINDTPWGDD